MSGDVLVPEVLPATADEWAERIRGHQLAAVESIVAIGQDLVAAKASLPHGEFGKVGPLVGMSARTVQRYMAIAGNDALAKTTHASHLPASWTTLYELAQVPADELEQEIGAGRVTADMERADATNLANRVLNRARPAKPEKAPPSVDDAKARAEIEKACRYGNTYVRDVAKRAKALAMADGELPAAKQLLATAQYLAAQVENKRHNKGLQNLAAQLLTDLATQRLTRSEAHDQFRVALEAALNNPDAPGSFEHAASKESSPVPPPVGDQGTSPVPPGDVPVDQGPSSEPAPPVAEDVEAVVAAAPGADESATSSAPSSFEGVDVEPDGAQPEGDDDAPGTGGPLTGAPALSLEAFWSQLTAVQRDALEIVVGENAKGLSVRYSNKTASDGLVASLYHQTADVLLDFELVAFVADTMRSELEATERGIELVLTFGKIAAGEGHGSASGPSPAADTEAEAELPAFVWGPWDELDDAGRWAQLEEPERRMLVEAMWAADADDPPAGYDDRDATQVELENLGLFEPTELDDGTFAATLTDEGLRLVRAHAGTPTEGADVVAAPRGEVTVEEPVLSGYAGAQGFVEGVHDRHGGVPATKPDPLRQAGCALMDGLTELEATLDPSGSTPEKALAAFVMGRTPADRVEDREQIKWWRDQLNGALLLTEEVRAGS